MPFVHGKSTAVFLGGTDVSSFLNSVDQTISRDVSETSVFGAQAKSYLKGHKDGTISLSGYWDGAANAIDAVMSNALGNVMNGYGSELLTPAGDALSDYVTLGNIQAASTPLAGFTHSVEFLNNLTTTIAYKTGSVVQGQRYLMEVFVQMNDSTAPRPGDSLDVNADFRFNVAGNISTSQSLVSVSLISGSLYKCSISFVAASTLTNSNLIGIAKLTTQSSKAFRIAGLSLRPAASVAMTRTVDTYGPELLSAGEDVTDYPNRSQVSNATTPISGFANSIYFQDASVLRLAYKYFTPVSGTPYIFSAIVQLDNDAIPIVGSVSGPLRDIIIIARGAGANYEWLTESLGGNRYRVSAKNREFTTNINFGLQKSTTLTSTGFRASGYSLREIIPVTVPTAPALSICEAGASTVGSRCLVVQAHDTSYQVTSPTADTVAVSAEFQIDGSFGSGAFRGVVLAANTTYASGTNTASVDNGATTFGGLVANFHVLDNSGFVTMKIQHSTDNSTWVDLLTSTSFVQSGFEHRTTPNVVYRYLRVNITSSGTPRIVVTAARK